MIFGGGLVAGLLAQIGRAIGSDTLRSIGRWASWVLPFEALYQDALHLITSGDDRLRAFRAGARPVRRLLRRRPRRRRRGRPRISCSSAPPAWPRSRGGTCPRELGRPGLACLAPARLEEGGEPDREHVEHDERDDREDRRHRIDAREDHPDHDHHEHADPPGPPQHRCSHDPQPDEPEHEHGHLECQRHSDQDEADEAVVVLGAEQDLEVRRVVVRQEVDRGRQHHPVAEGEPAQPEDGGEGDEHRHRALVVLRESRGEEGPDLPEDDRHGDQQRRPEADPDRRGEGFDRAEGGRLPEVVRQRPVQPVEDVAVEDVGDDERDEDRSEHDEQPRPQLAQVLDERRLLAVAEPPRGEPHRASSRAAGCRPRTEAARACRPCR